MATERPSTIEQLSQSQLGEKSNEVINNLLTRLHHTPESIKGKSKIGNTICQVSYRKDDELFGEHIFSTQELEIETSTGYLRASTFSGVQDEKITTHIGGTIEVGNRSGIYIDTNEAYAKIPQIFK